MNLHHKSLQVPLQEEEERLERYEEAPPPQSGSGSKLMQKFVFVSGSLFHFSILLNPLKMTCQRLRRKARILLAFHIGCHASVELETEELFWIQMVVFDIGAIVPG